MITIEVQSQSNLSRRRKLATREEEMTSGPRGGRGPAPGAVLSSRYSTWKGTLPYMGVVGSQSQQVTETSRREDTVQLICIDVNLVWSVHWACHHFRMNTTVDFRKQW